MHNRRIIAYKAMKTVKACHESGHPEKVAYTAFFEQYPPTLRGECGITTPGRVGYSPPEVPARAPHGKGAQ